MSRKPILPPVADRYSKHFSIGKRTIPLKKRDQFLLSAIVEASDDAILSKTLDGVITSWNPSAERIFGYTAAEILGKPATVLFPLDRLQEEETILDRLRRGLPTDHFESIRLHKDGMIRHVSLTISPIKDAKGRVIGASTMVLIY